MVEIEGDRYNNSYLQEWYSIQEQLKKLKAREALLRKAIFEHYFPDPKEGTSSTDIGNGWSLKGKHVVNRDIDEAALGVFKNSEKAELVAVDSIVRYKPELKLREYKQLTEEQKHLVDNFLIIKPGMPQLTIVEPKKNV